MKMTGELKEKVEKAKSAEQAKEIITEEDVELTDEEGEEVAGGKRIFPGGRYLGTAPKSGGAL